MIKPFKSFALAIISLLLIGCTPRFGPSIDDVNVLIAIYNANTENTLSWDISDPESARSWEGVELHRTGEVVKLNLVDKNISVLPPDIGRLTSMRELVIQFHDIEVIPVSLFELPFLEKLDLSFANELRILPAEIGRLRRLETLVLQFTNITAVPAEIGNITTLRSLYLNNNGITSIPADYGQLENLKIFHIYHNSNHLPPTVPPEIGRLRNLQEFWIVPEGVSSGERFPLLNVICELETLHGTDIDIYPEFARCIVLP